MHPDYLSRYVNQLNEYKMPRLKGRDAPVEVRAMWRKVDGWHDIVRGMPITLYKYAVDLVRRDLSACGSIVVATTEAQVEVCLERLRRDDWGCFMLASKGWFAGDTEYFCHLWGSGFAVSYQGQERYRARMSMEEARTLIGSFGY